MLNLIWSFEQLWKILFILFYSVKIFPKYCTKRLLKNNIYLYVCVYYIIHKQI